MADDEDRTPMTRTELAMLWDLLGRWQATHLALATRRDIDRELAERFGG